jgi:hypothetical protein
MGDIRTLHPVSVDGDVIDGIYELTPSDGNTVLRPISDGNTSAFLAMVAARNPGVAFGTYALATALAATGLGVEGDVVCEDIVRTLTGGKSGTGATKYTFDDALTYPTAINLTQDQPATATFQSWGVGQTPLVVALSQSATAFSPGSDEFFGLGPVTVNGTAVNGVSSVSIETGIQVFPLRSDGLLGPRSIVIVQILPVLTITAFGDDARAAANEIGTALNGTTGAICFAKKRAATGFVADASTVHCSFQAKHGVVTAQQTTGDPRQVTIRIDAIANGSDLPLIINTATALP